MSFDDHIRVAIDRALTEVHASLDPTLRALTEAVAAEASAPGTRLASGLRALDEASSLGDVLTVLAGCAGREADRSAVLLVAEERLKGWRASGFDGAVGDARRLDVALDQSGLVGIAVRTRTTRVRPHAGAQTPVDDLPPFARGAGERDAAAMPVLLGGTVAAVVYADAPSRHGVLPAWPGALDLLARHAGLVLEARTARYLTGVPSGSPNTGVLDAHSMASGDTR